MLRNVKEEINVAKIKITREFDADVSYFKLTKKRGKITSREAFEAMEEADYFGEYLIQFNVPEEAPMDLYEDGDEWRIYTAKELLEEKIEEELYKAHEEGYEECKKDFNLEKKANNGWIPCSERLPEDGKRVIACFSHGLVTEMRYEGNGIFQDIYEYSTDVIRAWQQLPEPYREELEDE